MKRETLLVGALLALFFGLGLANLDLEQLYSPDSAEFSMLPRAMLHGAYRDVSQPGDPPHTKYPFGYPLLLLPAALVFPKNGAAYILACKLTTLLTGALALLGIFLFFKRPRGEPPPEEPLSAGERFLLLGLCSTAPVMLLFSSNVMSEVPLLCASIWTLHLARRVLKRGLKAAILLGLAVAAAYYVRGNGVVLLPTAVLYALARGEGTLPARILKAAAVSIAAAALVLPWVLRDMKVSKEGPVSGENYVSQILTPFENPFKPRLDAELAFKRVKMNTAYYSRVALAHAFPLGDPSHGGVEGYGRLALNRRALAAARLLRVIAILLIVLGILSHLRSDGLDLAILFPVFFAALLVVFTYRQHRYLLPLIPFTYYFLLRGARLCRKVGRFGAAAYGAAAVLLCANAAYCLSMVRGKGDGSLMPQLGAYLDSYAKEDAVVMSYPYTWFFSGRKCVPLDPKGASVPGFEEALARYNVSYIVADAWMSDMTEYDMMLRSTRLFGFKRLVQIGNHFLYKVEKLSAKERETRVSGPEADYRSAILHYAFLSEAADAVPEYHNTLGYFLYESGRYGRAIHEFQKAVALSPDDHIAHFNLGTAYLADERYEDALREYAAARECEFGYTIQHVLNKNIEIATIKRGISVDPLEPGNAYLYFHIAQLWAERGSYRKAIAELERAVKLDAALVPARLFLAENYAAVGEYGKAALECSAVLKKHPEAAEVKARLAEFRRLARKSRRGRAG